MTIGEIFKGQTCKGFKSLLILVQLKATDSYDSNMTS